MVILYDFVDELTPFVIVIVVVAVPLTVGLPVIVSVVPVELPSASPVANLPGSM